MKNIIIVAIIVFFSVNAFSQIEEMPDNNNQLKFGPNLRHYVHPFFNLGFAANGSEGEGADILYASTHSFEFGYRYKYKIAEFLSIGADISYLYNAFHLKQNDTKLIPNPINHDKEKFQLSSGNTTVFLRINYSKRDNKLGNYIDLGGYGTYTYKTKRKYGNYASTITSNPNFEYIIVTEENLDYFEELNYGATIRFGFDKFSIFGKYRLSDMFTQGFKRDITTSELPRLEIGLQYSIYLD